MTVQHRNAFATQLKYGSGLSALGNLQRLLAFKCRHLDFRTDSSLGIGNRNHAIEIVPLTLEEGVFFDAKHKIQVSRGAAVYASFTETCKANASSVFNPGRNFGVDGFLLHHPTFTTAARAWIANYTSRAVACRTSARNAEKSLLVSELPTTATRTATRRSFPVRAS